MKEASPRFLLIFRRVFVLIFFNLPISIPLEAACAGALLEGQLPVAAHVERLAPGDQHAAEPGLEIRNLVEIKY